MCLDYIIIGLLFSEEQVVETGKAEQEDKDRNNYNKRQNRRRQLVGTVLFRKTATTQSSFRRIGKVQLL